MGYWIDGRTRSIEESIKREKLLNADIRFVDYQPGNGTRYELLFTRLPRLISQNLGWIDDAWYVTLSNFYGGIRTMGWDRGFLHPSYVMEKLRVTEADAYVLAELIVHVCGGESMSGEAREIDD